MSATGGDATPPMTPEQEVAALRAEMDALLYAIRRTQAELSWTSPSSRLWPGIDAMRLRFETRYAHCYARYVHLTRPETAAAAEPAAAPAPLRAAPPGMAAAAPPVAAGAPPAGPWRGAPPGMAAPPPAVPGPITAAWTAAVAQLRRARSVVASEIALDGLAYLGVLLTFTGTLGFYLFAYDSVSNAWLRSCGPLLLPAALAALAVRLRGRGSALVASSLELLSAAILPVILSAALSTLLPAGAIVARTVMALALTGVYAAIAVRRPASPLRYAVAGMLWMAVWTAGLAFRDGGYSPEQVLLTAGAILVTLAAVRAAPGLPFAAETRVAAVVGTGTVVVLTLLFAIREGGPPVPLLLTGLAAVVSIELVGERSRRTVELSLLQSMILAVALGSVAQAWGAAVVGALAASAFLALLAWQELRRPHPSALLVPLAGAITGMALALLEPWTAVAAGAALSSAAHARRLRIWPQPRAAGVAHAARVTAVVAALVPAALAAGLWRALAEGRAILTMTALLTGLALVARRRAPGDPLYRAWAPAVAAAAVAASPAARGSVRDVELAAAVALAVLCMAVSRSLPSLRVWPAAAAGVWASVLLLDGVGAAADLRPVLWSAAALAAVVAASRLRGSEAGHTALAGHAGAGAALALVQPGGRAVAALAAWTAGWAWTVVAAERGRSPAVTLLERLAPALRNRVRTVPDLVLAVSVPLLVADAVDVAGLAGRHRTAVGIALALTALADAGAVRALAGRRPLAGIVAATSVVLSGIAVTVVAPDLNAVIVTAAGSVAVVAIMGGAARRPVMTWFAWVMSVVLAVLLGRRAGVPIGSLHLVAIVAGGLLLAGSLAWDDLRCGRRRPGEGLRLGWLVPPTAVGALAVPAGMAFTFSHGAAEIGWWSLAVAAFYATSAVQLRSGLVTLPAYSLAAVGAAALLPSAPFDHPLQLVPFGAVLTAASFVLSRGRRASRDPWLDWALPPLIVAHLVVAVALTRSLALDAVAQTWPAAGGVGLALWAWRRHPAWAVGGMALVVVGAHAAGPGWFALALGATSAAGAVAAARREGGMRAALQAASVAAAAWAWLQTLVWIDRASGDDVALSALLGAGGSLVIAVAIRLRRVRPDWAWTWGALTTAAVAVSAAVAPAEGVAGRTAFLGTAEALAMWAVAACLVDAPLRRPELRWAAVAAAGAGWLEGLGASEWTRWQEIAVSAVVASALAAALAVAMRRRILPVAWTLPWAALATAALTAAGIAWASLAADGGAGAGGAAAGVAVGMGLFAAAAATSVQALGRTEPAWASAAAVAWGWSALTFWASWPASGAATATALAAGGAALITALLIRSGRVSAPWAPPAGVVTAAGIVTSLALAVAAVPPESRHPAALAVAAGLALLAAACGTVAAPLRRDELRFVAAGLAAAAAAVADYDWQPGAAASVSAAVGIGSLTLLAALTLWRARPASAWLQPIILAGALLSAAALVMALTALPDRAPLIAATLAVAAETGAAGLTLRRPGPLYVSPVLACVAWFLYATDALTGNANWFTSAVGLTVLVMVDIARWDRRRGTLPGDQHVMGEVITVLDGVGMAFLVGATLVQVLFDSPWYGLLGVALGIALAAWGTLTRVRHRLEFGGGVVVLTLVLLLAVPVVRLAPQVTGAWLWGTLAIIGLALLFVAAGIEQGRGRIVEGKHRFDRRTRGWE